MTKLREGFKINYEVVKIDLVKPGTSGEMEGTPYPAKVQFNASILYTVEDDVLGTVEKEDKLEFRIVCDDDKKMAKLYAHVMALKSAGVVLQLNGSIPKFVQNQDAFRVTCFSTDEDIYKRYPLPKK